ncbi:MAG TPA: DnaJ domain-containing protein [Candidatus Nanoarchaeia archaeon]|nr:DnaJ domain-containing protein [Candidatus Nanoarchaeia archaeon]
MVKINLKGNEFEVKFVTGSANRYADLFRNKIIFHLRKIGVHQDFIKLKEEPSPLVKKGVEVFWYLNGSRCYYSYDRQARYVDNLQVVSKLIEIEASNILDKSKTMEEFIFDFKEDSELVEKRKEAREYLNLDENEKDMLIIDKQYKTMAKDAHPDMPNGSTEKFKKLNEAHKILKKELE